MLTREGGERAKEAERRKRDLSSHQKRPDYLAKEAERVTSREGRDRG